MTKAHQLLREIRHHTLRPTVALGGDAFHEGSHLRNTHSTPASLPPDGVAHLLSGHPQAAEMGETTFQSRIANRGGVRNESYQLVSSARQVLCCRERAANVGMRTLIEMHVLARALVAMTTQSFLRSAAFRQLRQKASDGN